MYLSRIFDLLSKYFDNISSQSRAISFLIPNTSAISQLAIK